MTARYLLTITDESAARLEKWLGGAIQLEPMRNQRIYDPLADLRVPPDDPRNSGVGPGYLPDNNRAEAERRLAALAPVTIAGLDAITDEEYEFIARRLRTSGPLYHAGGPS